MTDETTPVDDVVEGDMRVAGEAVSTFGMAGLSGLIAGALMGAVAMLAGAVRRRLRRPSA